MAHAHTITTPSLPDYQPDCLVSPRPDEYADRAVPYIASCVACVAHAVQREHEEQVDEETLEVPASDSAEGERAVVGAEAEQPAEQTAVEMASGAAPTPESNAPDTQPSQGRGPLHISRRKLLVAGSGIVVVSGVGAGLIAKHVHAGYLLRSKVLGKLSSAHWVPPTPHPQPLPDGPLSTPNDVTIFDGKLMSGWDDWSWGSHLTGDSDVTYRGKPVITAQLDNWSGVYYHADLFDTSGLGYFQCYVRAENHGGQFVTVYVDAGAKDWRGGVLLGDYTQGGSISQSEWRLVRVPLAALRSQELNAEGIVLQADSPNNQGTIHLADLRFVYHPDLHAPTVKRIWTYDLETITLAFQFEMDPAAAGTETSYMIAAAAGTQDPNYPQAQPVSPLRARYHPAARTVSLLVPTPMQEGSSYSVSLAPIPDRFGVKTVKGSQGQVQVTSNPLEVNCDVSAERKPISPEIYGMSNVTDYDLTRELGVTVARWGGTPQSRYNWKLGNAFNAGRDYYFQNGNYGHTSAADRAPSGMADQQIAANTANKLTTLLQIPTLGWVAKDDSSVRSQGVPGIGGMPTVKNGDAVPWYDPTANRQLTSVPSRARKGAPFSDPPDLNDPTVAQDEWVHHLVRRFGQAAEGGVKYYAMDNEPEIWCYEETDVRPAELGYEQMRDMHLDYANAIKDVDPTALITGPVPFFWPTIRWSPLDRGNDSYATLPDYNAHGRVPFLSWWLQEIRKHDEKIGRRSLDVLDWHLYPQGNVYSDDVSDAMATLRLRSTRILWDPTYVEESWIKERMRAIPQLKEILAANYPGTKLAFTEWSWGAEGSVNGAIALAEVLGIYTREGLDMACFWGALDYNTPAHFAFKMYGNYDTSGSSFIGSSFQATTSQNDLLSCYGAQPDGRTVLLMVINKSVDSDVTPTLHVKHVVGAMGGATPTRARVWRYWPSDTPKIVQGSDVPLSLDGSSDLHLTYTFPASSVTLLRIEPGA